MDGHPVNPGSKPVGYTLIDLEAVEAERGPWGDAEEACWQAHLASPEGQAEAREQESLRELFEAGVFDAEPHACDAEGCDTQASWLVPQRSASLYFCADHVPPFDGVVMLDGAPLAGTFAPDDRLWDCVLREHAYNAWRRDVPPAATEGFTRACDVEEAPVRFEDKPLLQKDTFHLLAGRKAGGKGIYLCNVAARKTRGELSPKKTVVWIASEDSRSQDLIPRLTVAGADLGRVMFLDAQIKLPQHAGALADMVKKIGNVGLLVIDPLSDFIGGVDSNDEAKVRPALVPLNPLADELGCLIIGVRHLTEKEAKNGVVAALLGSSAWAQVPRVVIGIVEDPEEEDLRHITVARGNRLPRGQATLAFRIVGVDRSDHGHETEIPRVEWLGQSDRDLDAMLQGGAGISKTKLAREAILDELRKAPGIQMLSDELDARVAEKVGLKMQSLRNVRTKMRADGLIRSVPEKDRAGDVKRWWVVLTEEESVSGSPDTDPSDGSSW